MKRIFLFIATNVAVLVVISIVLRVLGVDSLLERNGSSLDLTSLLVFSAVVGFSGSLISLLASKWIAKMSTGARVIDTRKGEWRVHFPGWDAKWDEWVDSDRVRKIERRPLKIGETVSTNPDTAKVH